MNLSKEYGESLLASVASGDGIALDYETHKFQPGLQCPPIVCAGYFSESKGGELLSVGEGYSRMIAILESDRTYLNANTAFDLIVFLKHAESLGEERIGLVIQKYLSGQVWDIAIAEPLIQIQTGYIYKDPVTGGPLLSGGNGKQTKRYSLATICYIRGLGKQAKQNDLFRTSYALLEDIPIDEWPIEAKQYPIDDAENAYRCALLQAKTTQTNLLDMPTQCFADFVAKLGASSGLSVDQEKLSKVKEQVLLSRSEDADRLVSLGYFKPDKSGKLKKQTSKIKLDLIRAYAKTKPCPVCSGSGKVPGKTKCKKVEKDGSPCKICGGSGQKPIACKVVSVDLENGDLDFTGCSGTGEIPISPVPRTDKGGISCGRDPLNESGHDDLIFLASHLESEKLVTNYIPWLEEADGIPRTFSPKIIKATGRMGYGTEHQLPRSGGMRECLTARPGNVLILSDYVGCELITHANNLLTWVGYSNLADSLNRGIKIHDLLAATVGKIDYEEFLKNKKGNKKLLNLRQSAKPINFGAPGLLGAKTLVIQQRVQGPDTVSDSGKVFKGLRFCMLAGASKECGKNNITSYKGKNISPVCGDCIKVASEILKHWKELFPEHVEYFKLVGDWYMRGYVRTPWAGRIRTGAGMCSTANNGFQGEAGDIVKDASCRILVEQTVRKDSDLYGTRYVLSIHDEIVIESREDQAPAAAKRLKKVMEKTMIDHCPAMEKAVEAEAAITRFLSKGAEPVFDSSGELTLWEP